MASSDLETITPDEKLSGQNLARTIRLISKIFLDWTTYNPQGNHKKRSYLKSIYFDKLAEFFCRIWDELSDQKHVRYPSAFPSYQGFHGPGRAIKINRSFEKKLSEPDDHRLHELAYFTEVVEKLKPSIFGNTRILFKLDKKYLLGTTNVKFILNSKSANGNHG